MSTPSPHWMRLTVAVLTVVAVLLAFLAGGFALFSVRLAKHRDEHAEMLVAIGDLKAQHIKNWRAERLADARRASESPFLVEAFERWLANPDDAGLRQQWRARLELERDAYGYANVLLVDATGGQLLAVEDEGLPLAQATRLAMADALDQDRLGPRFAAMYRRADGRIRLDAVALMRDSAGEPRGAIILQTDPEDYLHPLVRTWHAPTTSGESYLVGRRGDQAVYLTSPKHHTDDWLTLAVPLHQTERPAAQALLGQHDPFLGRDYRGVRVLADVAPIPGAEWYLVSTLDHDEIEAIALRESWLAVGLAALSLLLILALGGWILRSRQAVVFEQLYRIEQAERAAQEQYRATLYSIGDAVITTDGDGRIQQLNRVAEELTGWNEAEAQGQPLDVVFRIVNEHSRQPVDSPVEQVLRQGEVVGLANHTVLIARDGREHPIADSGAPIFDGQGKCTGVVLVFRDQTDEKAAERALREREALFRTIMENLPVMVALLDSNCTPIYVNRACVNTLGWSEQECLSPEILSKMYPDPVYRQQVVDYILAADRTWTDHNPVTHDGRVLATSWTNVRLADQTVISIGIDITQRKQAEQAVRDQAAMLEIAGRMARFGGWRVELPDVRIVWSDEICRLHGLPPGSEPTAEQAESFVLGSGREQIRSAFERCIASGESFDLECRIQPTTGSPIWVRVVGQAESSDDGALRCIRGAMQDITERHEAQSRQAQLEAQLHQAHKMEAVGRLAGGVAHDFNNLLTVILGRSQLILRRKDLLPQVRESLEEIIAAGQRSAELTRQLLAFARKQTITPRVLDLNQTVGRTLKMLGRMIGEDIHLLWQPAPKLSAIRIDPAQLDQILANLTVNARDAIAGVGTITIATHEVELDQAFCQGLEGAQPGRYVRLTVSDTGCGMNEETRQRLFEPFFTTKDVGAGTGLGLATIYGIVHQNEGFVRVLSTEGEGTTFEVYLPAIANQQPTEPPPAEGDELPTGGETVLLVEDESFLLRLATTLLENLGYRVLPARGPSQALEMVKQHKGSIELVLSDVVMPEMNGRELWTRLQAIRPDLRCLFMSGYPADAISHSGVLDSDVHFLQKPFTDADLAKKVRTALDSP